MVSGSRFARIPIATDGGGVRGPRDRYRHADAAQVYGNEEYAGTEIDSTDADREHIVFATEVVLEGEL